MSEINSLQRRLLKVGAIAGATAIVGYLVLSYIDSSRNAKKGGRKDGHQTSTAAKLTGTAPKKTSSESTSPVNKVNEAPKDSTKAPEVVSPSESQAYGDKLKTAQPIHPLMQTVLDLGIPKVGDGFDLQPSYTKALYEFAKKTDEIGLGVSYVDMYGVPTVIVTDPDVVRKTLSHNVHHALWAGLTTASTSFFGKNVLFVLEGDEWRFLRNIIKQALTKQNVKLMQLDLISTAAKFTDKIRSGTEVDMNSVLNLYHLSAIGKSAFNFDLNCLEDENLGPNAISQAFDFFIDELPRRSLNPDQSVVGNYEIDNEDNRKWYKAKETVRKTINNVIIARFNEYGYDEMDDSVKVLNFKGVKKRNDLLDCMIFAYIAEKMNELDQNFDADKEIEEIDFRKVDINDLIENLSDNLVEIMFAGYNTNVGTMSNALHFLALHKDVQEQCFQEIESFMLRYDIMDLSDFEAISENFNMDKFPLLQNVFFETLRLRPPAPLVSRLTTKEVEFKSSKGGETILLPVNFQVWFPSEYLHRHKANWYNNNENEYDPDEFRPWRFSALKSCYKIGSFLPFSSGPRDCIGKNFAINEALFAFIYLLKKYEFDAAPDFKYQSFFNGFGYRPYDETTQKVCMRLVPTRRP